MSKDLNSQRLQLDQDLESAIQGCTAPKFDREPTSDDFDRSEAHSAVESQTAPQFSREGTSAQAPIEPVVAAEPLGECQPLLAEQRNGRPFDAEGRGTEPVTSDSVPAGAEAFTDTGESR